MARIRRNRQPFSRNVASERPDASECPLRVGLSPRLTSAFSSRRLPLWVGCVTSIQWPAVARAAFRGGWPGCFLKAGFGDFGTACATPSYVCSALGPVTPNVALRAPECPFMADSRGSLCSPKAVLEESGSCREGQLTGLVANSRNRPKAVADHRPKTGPSANVADPMRKLPEANLVLRIARSGLAQDTDEDD